MYLQYSPRGSRHTVDKVTVTLQSYFIGHFYYLRTVRTVTTAKSLPCCDPDADIVGNGRPTG